MAVQKTIAYVDKTGVQRTTTITIDLMKFAIGTDDEQVFLTVSAPGLTAGQTWQRNIDKLVEDALYANGAASRYTAPSGYIKNGSAWVTATSVDWGTIYLIGDKESNTVSGVLQSLRNA